jgi:hypothetical protein
MNEALLALGLSVTFCYAVSVAIIKIRLVLLHPKARLSLIVSD